MYALIYLEEKKKRKRNGKENHSVAIRCARMAALFRAIPWYKGFSFKSARLWGSEGSSRGECYRERERITGSFVGRSERELVVEG